MVKGFSRHGGDEVLDADAGNGDAEIQRQVGVAPDVKPDRVL